MKKYCTPGRLQVGQTEYKKTLSFDRPLSSTYKHVQESSRRNHGKIETQNKIDLNFIRNHEIQQHRKVQPTHHNGKQCLIGHRSNISHPKSSKTHTSTSGKFKSEQNTRMKINSTYQENPSSSTQNNLASNHRTDPPKSIVRTPWP